MKANVLVTGGLGFVGAYVGDHLLKEGHTPFLFDISHDTEILEKLGIEDQVETIQGDITETTDITRAIVQNDVTHIIHLASLLISQAQDNPRKVIDINIRGMNNLLETVRTFENQIDRLVWASSETVYGSTDLYDAKPVSESDLVNPTTLYGASKLYCEQQAKLYNDQFDVSHIGLRPTIIYGPYSRQGDSSFVARLIENPVESKDTEIEHGDLNISWLYVKDVARAFVRAAFVNENKLNQRIYNVRGEVATVRDAAEVVSNFIPDSNISVSSGQPNNWSIQDLDTTSIESDLGFYPEFDLESGIKDYIKQIR